MKTLRTFPWVVIILIAVLCALFLPIWPNGAGGFTHMTGYVVSWGGAVFKAMSGGVIGFWFVRHVLKVNISEIPDWTSKALAGLGAAIVIAAFIIGVCISV
jgi:hypothetical protein